jgi:hypothetical protein
MNLVIFLACSLGVPPMSTSVDTQKLTCAGGWEEGRMIRIRCEKTTKSDDHATYVVEMFNERADEWRLVFVRRGLRT